MTSNTDDRRAASSAPRGTSKGTRAFGECPLGADDSLRNGRLRDEKCARDLLRRQPSQKAECEGDTRIGGENRMAGRKHQAQEVVAYVIVEGRVEIGLGPLLCGLELVAELHQLALESLPPAEEIDRTMLRGAHQPRARVARDARFRPLLQAATRASCARSSARPGF